MINLMLESAIDALFNSISNIASDPNNNNNNNNNNLILNNNNNNLTINDYLTYPTKFYQNINLILYTPILAAGGML